MHGVYVSCMHAQPLSYNRSSKLTLGFALIQHHIVYMGDHSHPNSESVIRANHEILASVTGRHVTQFEIEFMELILTISVLLILIYLEKD